MSELIETAIRVTNSAKIWVLNSLARVPEDKIDWAPSPTSKSALRIAAHIGVSNIGFASALRGETSPATTIKEYWKLTEDKELSITTRQDAVKLIERSTDFLIKVLGSLKQEQLEGRILSPIGDLPTSDFIFFATRHMSGHASQIDYLQTIWGDPENNY